MIEPDSISNLVKKLSDDQKNTLNIEKEDISIDYFFNLFVAFFFFTASLVLALIFSILTQTHPELALIFYALVLFGFVGYYILGILLFAYILSKTSKKVRIFYKDHKKIVEYGLGTFGLVGFGFLSFVYIGRDVALVFFGGILAVGVKEFYKWLEDRNK